MTSNQRRIGSEDGTAPSNESLNTCRSCGGTACEEISGVSSPVCLKCGLVIETGADIPTLSNEGEGSETSELGSWDTYYSVTNSTEQQVATALEQVETLSDAVGLPSEARRQTAQVYASAARINLTDGRPISLTVAAALCIGSRKTGSPRPSECIAEAADLDPAKVKQMIRTFQEEIDCGYVDLSPSAYVPYFCSEVGLSEDVAQQAAQLIVESETSMQTSGCHPSGIAAAAIYDASEGAVTQRRLAAVTGVSKETIRVRLNDLRRGDC